MLLKGNLTNVDNNQKVKVKYFVGKLIAGYLYDSYVVVYMIWYETSH